MNISSLSLKIIFALTMIFVCPVSGFTGLKVIRQTGIFGVKVKEQPRILQIASCGKLVLSNSESELFNMLVQCVKDKELNTTIRIAGGWVRDKLLSSKDEHTDIDVALDNMSGKNFATIFDDWCKLSKKDSLNVAVIKPNPSKSKHLETAHVVLSNKFVVDFVNLRTDEYCTASRIPTVVMGSPSEDAHRRDLTINSLFYNIHSGEVEDFTSLGLSDLKQGLVRTPLSALHTLRDDPLRALRAIRFACRLNFRMDNDLAMACNHSQVRENLRLKVSRERVYSELEAVLRRPSSARAAVMLHSFDLWRDIMVVPAGDNKTLHVRNNTFHSVGLATLLMAEALRGEEADWALGRDMWEVNDNRKIFA
jgi:tRNA nucleotidyltransferase (CCA-adding enzyme)